MVSIYITSKGTYSIDVTDSLGADSNWSEQVSKRVGEENIPNGSTSYCSDSARLYTWNSAKRVWKQPEES